MNNICNTLIIIPARSGSKSIPHKNIVDVNGKPLIAYSIEPAIKVKQQGLVKKVIVSTDSEQYAEIARHYGAEVPFLRPANISGDKAKSIEFILHALDFFEKSGEHYDAIMLLQPTSPLRTPQMLKNALEIFIEKKADSLISCYEEAYINDLVMYHRDSDGFLSPLNPNHNKGARRQDHGSNFVRNGAIYISRTEYLITTGQIISDKPALFEMPKSCSINLDTPEDLEMLRKLL